MLKRLCPFLIFFLSFHFNTTLIGNESTHKYFPRTLGSFWVYEDQDGNELTRRAIEGEEIAGEIYHGFSYEPEIEDWKVFHRYVYPALCHIGEEWVTLLVGDEVEKAVKARLTKEMETYTKIAKKRIENNVPPSPDFSFNIKFNVEIDTKEKFYLLPSIASANKEWNTTQIKAKITMMYDIKGLPDSQDADETLSVIFDFQIDEIGKILGSETVETPAGTFEECLKIEYRTQTSMTSTEAAAPSNEPGETVTTLWLAPNIGIVKFHQEADDMFLKVVPFPEFQSATKVKTLELKKYEIKPDMSKDDNSK